MVDGDELPTIGEALSNWLGVQLPSIPLPQTVKNFDKAIAKVVLAAGENFEAWIKGNTAKAKAQSKIDLADLVRTEDEKRKLTNRLAATKAALEDMRVNPPGADATSEIEDDWLNLFVRLAEDKSSEELQLLFGRILSGEIKRPGSFSLRTLLFMSTISKQEAESLTSLLAFAIDGMVIPFQKGKDGRPTDAERFLLEELAVGGSPTVFGGMEVRHFIDAGQKRLFLASHRGILLENETGGLDVALSGQPITRLGRELISIANSPATDVEFLKQVATVLQGKLRELYAAEVDNGRIKLHVVSTEPVEGGQIKYEIIN